MTFPLAPTQFGFSWGPLTVTRQLSDPKWGVQIEVSTSRGYAIEIRVTPSGQLRVGPAKKLEASR